MNNLLYIVASLLIISSFSFFIGSPQKIGNIGKSFLNASAFLGGVFSIIFLSWYIVLVTIITMWIIYGISLIKAHKEDFILNSRGEKIIYNGHVLDISNLVIKIYELMHGVIRQDIIDFKHFLKSVTEYSSLEDTLLKVYPSVYPDQSKNYIIRTNNSVGFIEVFEKNSDLLHVGFQLLFGRKMSQSEQLKLLKSVFSIIKPKYGTPVRKSDNMIIFMDSKTTCIVVHEKRKVESSNDVFVLTTRIFNKKFWNPENEQIQLYNLN